MSEKQTFHAIIEIVNRASAPLHKIQRDVAGLLAPIGAVRVAVKALGQEVGMVRLANNTSVALARVGALRSEIGRLLGPLTAIGAAASVTGVLGASKRSSEYGEALLHQSNKTGVPVRDLSRLHYVAELEDVETAQLDKALAALNVNLFKAMHGKNKELDAMLRRFIGANWKSQVRTVEDGFAMLAEAYQKAPDLAKNAVAAQGFGKKMGVEVVPVLLKSRQAIREAGDEFERFNGIWTRERAEAAAEAADNWKRMQVAGQGLAFTIGNAVTPSLMKLIVPLTEWIAKNRMLVAAKVDRVVQEIGTALREVDWKGVADGVKAIWNAFKGVVELLGAKGTIFAAVAVMFGPLAVNATLAAVAIGRVAISLGLVVARVAVLAGMQVFGFFASLAAGARLALGPMIAFNLALATNPIGAVILGITALAGAAYLIYRYWEPIKGFFKGLWDGIVSVFQGAWAVIKPIVDAVIAGAKALSGGENLADYSGAGYGPMNEAAPPRATVDRSRGASGGRSQVDVRVKFDNVPRGTATQSRARGNGVNLNVGKSFQAG